MQMDALYLSLYQYFPQMWVRDQFESAEFG